MSSKSRSLVFIVRFICVIATLIHVSSCTRSAPDFYPLKVTELGNPKVPPPKVPELRYSICSVLNRCSPQVSVGQCLDGIDGATGIAPKLGLPGGAYPSLADVEAAESSGSISSNVNSVNGCVTAVNRLSCADLGVRDAYQPSASNPFTGAAAMIPATPGTCNDFFSTLSLTPNEPNGLGVGATLGFTPVGGVPPFLYSVVGGAGTIGPSGNYVAPNHASIETVRVVDALNHTSDVTFTVGAIHTAVWSGSIDSNWSNPGNWSGGKAPGPSDLAILDSSCTRGCSPSIGSSIDVGGIVLMPGYNGTVSQGSGAGITIEAYGYTQESGTFLGGADPITLNNGNLVINNGTFKSTKGTLLVTGDLSQESISVLKISPLANFDANGGTIYLGTGISSDPAVSLDLGGASLNSLTFGLGRAGNSVSITGSFSVAQNLVVDNYFAALDGGTVYASGNVSMSGGGGPAAGGGSATIVLSGASGQTLMGTYGMYYPSITLAGMNGETIRLSGTVDVMGNWTYVSGTVDPGTSLVEFGAGRSSDPPELIAANGMSFNQVNLLNGQGGITLSGTLSALGDLGIQMMKYTPSVLAGGVIQVGGNLSVRELNQAQNVSIVFTGAKPAVYTNSAGAFVDGPVVVRKTGGSLTLQNNLPATSFGVDSGTVSLNGNVLSAAAALSISPGAVLNCNGGCGAGTSCGQGLNQLRCGTLLNSGTITP